MIVEEIKTAVESDKRCAQINKIFVKKCRKIEKRGSSCCRDNEKK